MNRLPRRFVQSNSFKIFQGTRNFGIWLLPFHGNNWAKSVTVLNSQRESCPCKHNQSALHYGILYPGWYDLSEMLDQPNTCDLDLPAIGRDLNENGVIVGQSGGITSPEPRIGISGVGVATAWDLSQGLACTTTLSTLEGAPDIVFWSGAWAINNEEDPVIVGLSVILRPCECNSAGVNARAYSGFACVYDGSPSLDELEPLAGDIANSAFDVATPSSGGAMIVGHSRCWAPDLCFEETSGGSCYSQVESAAWDASMLSGTGLDRLASNAHVARGVNDDNLAIGWGFNSSDPCFSTAVYWPDAENPFNLGSIMPDGQNGDQSRAEAINNLSFPWAVGWNLDQEIGVLWIKSGSGDDDWEAYDLNTLIGPNTIECDEEPVTAWEIIKAHDINDSNWIVGTAYHTCIPGEHAVLLTPIGTCPWDLNGDGDIDEDDVNILGISSGCQPSRICYEDVNNDLVVDSQDLAEIMNNFGECGGWGSPFTESYFTYWGIGGGWDALRNQEVTGSQIAAALNESTEVQQVAALYMLLSQ